MKSRIFNTTALKKFESKSAIIAYILEKTAPVFNKQGYIGSSLSDLTKATNLTKGAIYGNFLNKEELAVEVFKLNVRKYIRPLLIQTNKGSNALEKIYAIIIYYRNYYDTVKDIGGCPILNVGVDAKHVNNKLFEASKKISQQMIKGLIGILKDGVENKELNPEIDAEKIAKIIFTMIEGGTFLAFLHEDKKYIDIALDSIRDHILPKIKV